MPAPTIPYIDEYAKGKTSFPDDNVPFDQKGEKWHLQYAKAIISDYASNNGGIGYNERDRICENREWAAGTNSQDTYKDIILEFNRDEGERQAFSALDYQIIPVISKFESDFIGFLSTIKHRATANSIDPTSLRKKTEAKMQVWLKSKMADQLAPLDSMLGIKPNEEEYVPKTKAELDIYEQFGGFKLSLEMGLEAGMKHCFEFSKWNEEVTIQLLRDLFANNMIACRDYLDLDTYTVKVEYIDIQNFICQRTKSPSFENSRYYGFIKYISIADLRVLTAGQPGWDEKRLQQIAKKFANINGNTKWYNVGMGDTYNPFNERTASQTDHPWNSHLIPVAVLEGESTMVEHTVEKLDAAGNTSYYPSERDRKYNRADRKSINTPIKVWHKMSYIIGTDFVFDTGLQHDIPRPTYEDAKPSFHAYRIAGQSYVEKLKPHAKQIQLMYLKVQALGLKSIPPGVAVDYKALRNMVLNKKEMDPMDVLKIFYQTGTLIYNNTNSHARLNVSGGVPPVKDLRGSNTLSELLAVIADHKNQMKDITGIDNTAGKSEPTAYQAKMVFTSTDIALKQSHIAFMAMFYAASVNISARLKDLLAYSSKAREIYGPIIGITNAELLEMVSDLPLAHLAIDIEIEADDQDKQAVDQAAIAAMKPGKEGVPVLRFSDYLLIQRMLKVGNIKWCHAYIAHKEAEIEKMGIIRANEAKKADQQMALTIEQAKAQEEAKMKADEHQRAIDKAKIETDEKIRLHKETAVIDEQYAVLEFEREKQLKQMELEAARMNKPVPV